MKSLQQHFYLYLNCFRYVFFNAIFTNFGSVAFRFTPFRSISILFQLHLQLMEHHFQIRFANFVQSRSVSIPLRSNYSYLHTIFSIFHMPTHITLKLSKCYRLHAQTYVFKVINCIIFRYFPAFPYIILCTSISYTYLGCYIYPL